MSEEMQKVLLDALDNSDSTPVEVTSTIPDSEWAYRSFMEWEPNEHE